MYQMKKGGSKSSKQQAAIAMSMKAKGKKPKMQPGGEPQVAPQFGMVSRSTPITGMADAKLKFKSDNGDYVTRMKTDADGNVIKSKARRTIGGFLRGAPRLKDNLKKGGSVGKSKMKMGGSLKPVDSSKNPGLAKLPTEVRNKMGYKKKGGSVKMKMGGSCGTPKSLKKK